jgi:glycosyltransferase involved in cell wall biosynthesis
VRIEIVCSSREVFGADRSAVRLGALLRDLGHEVWLTVPAARPELGLTEMAAERGLVVIPAPVVVASSRGLSGLRSLAARARSDAELTIYNTSAVALRRGDCSPRALVLREWLEPRSLRHRALCALHRGRIATVVAVSHPVLERWRDCARDALPAHVCRNWIDAEWLAATDADDQEGILFAGRLSRWKGHMVLADAYERAFGDSVERPSLTYLGAEAAPSPFHAGAVELGERCRSLGARLLELTPDPRPHFRRAALVVVPSLHPEPFGNVILEGLAAGARIVTFPGGGTDDLAPLFADSLRVVPRHTAALADALRDWWGDGARGQSEAERATVRTMLRQRFTVSAVAPEWRRIINRLASR